MFSSYEILLGSNSPRRKELLKIMGIRFTHVNINTKETYPDSLSPIHIASYLSVLKSQQYNKKIANKQLLLTADTIVLTYSNKVLGKPKNKQSAVNMLNLLSGKKHKVITAITLTNNRKQLTKSCSTTVYFNPIKREYINFYVNNFNPIDKAGAYGIQEWIGLHFIKKIDGSYFNVVGLPTHLLKEMLQDFS